MAANIVTLEDLQNFKRELLEEIKKIISGSPLAPTKKWLKSSELRKILPVSAGTLQNLRVNGILPFTKIGGVIFYEYTDIEKLIEANHHTHEFPTKKYGQL